MKAIAYILGMMAIAYILAGCESVPKPKIQVIKVQSDNYCRLAKVRDWSVSDTSQSIDYRRQDNAVWQCTCVKPKPKQCS